jgi:hypothetical protein
MGRLPILLLAVVLAFGLSMAGAARVAACSCAQLTRAEAFEAADLVVEGVIIGKSAPEQARITYTVSVERVHKGEAGEQLHVISAQDSAACGLMMAVGQRWRLNISEFDGQLTTWLCDRSELLSEEAPIRSAPAEPPDPGSSLMALLFAFGSGLVGVLALLLAWLARGSVR